MTLMAVAGGAEDLVVAAIGGGARDGKGGGWNLEARLATRSVDRYFSSLMSWVWATGPV